MKFSMWQVTKLNSEKREHSMQLTIFVKEIQKISIKVYNGWYITYQSRLKEEHCSSIFLFVAREGTVWLKCHREISINRKTNNSFEKR